MMKASPLISTDLINADGVFCLSIRRSLSKSHKFLVRRVSKTSFIVMLRVLYKLNALIRQAPDIQSHLEITYGDNVIVVGSPAGIS